MNPTLAFTTNFNDKFQKFVQSSTSASAGVKKFMNDTFFKPVTDTAKNVVGQAQQFVNNDLPVIKENISYMSQKALLPKVPFVSGAEMQKRGNESQKKYESQTEMQNLGQDAMDQLDYAPTKMGSAQLPNMMQPPQTSPDLESLRQKIIKGSGFTKAFQSYLQNIPVVNAPGGGGGQAYGSPYTYYPERLQMQNMQVPDQPDVTYPDNPTVMPRYLTYQPQEAQQYATQMGSNPEQVLLHEMLHQAPRPNSLEQALTAFAQLKKNPELNALLTALMTQHGDSPTPEETYAMLGETAGQSAINDPLYGQYYRGIFNPTAQPVVTKNNRGQVLGGSTVRNVVRKGK
jgi:hypothetical protein